MPKMRAKLFFRARGKVLIKDKYWHVLRNDGFDWVEIMADCLFSKIARDIAPASVVYSDENVMVFLDAQQVNRGTRSGNSEGTCKRTY